MAQERLMVSLPKGTLYVYSTCILYGEREIWVRVCVWVRSVYISYERYFPIIVVGFPLVDCTMLGELRTIAIFAHKIWLWRQSNWNTRGTGNHWPEWCVLGAFAIERAALSCIHSNICKLTFFLLHFFFRSFSPFHFVRSFMQMNFCWQFFFFFLKYIALGRRDGEKRNKIYYEIYDIEKIKLFWNWINCWNN